MSPPPHWFVVVELPLNLHRALARVEPIAGGIWMAIQTGARTQVFHRMDSQLEAETTAVLLGLAGVPASVQSEP